MKVKEMYFEERPREKAKKHGVDSLSNQELLALLLGTGTKKTPVLELSKELLHFFQGGLVGVSTAAIGELMKIEGIKEAKAIRIAACFELSRRLSYLEMEDVVSITQPYKLIDWLNKTIGYLMQEHFVVVFLNVQNEIMHYQTMFVGSLTSSVVHPREIFKEAIQCGCAKIICVHNHPSGNCEPSIADIEVTKLIQEVGVMIGIEVLDHLIVGRNNFRSLREMGLMD